MSRLIVKGLPFGYTEAKLRGVFTKYGEVTDCSLKYTKEGKFRRFAFVGFAQDSNATKAINELNNTFVDASRIQVEECKPFGDDTKPRAWSKYAKGSSAYKRAHPEEEEEESAHQSLNDSEDNSVKKPKFEGDAKFNQFLAANKRKIKTEEEEKGDDQEGEKEDLVPELLGGVCGDTTLSLILKNLPLSVKSKSIKDWLSPIRVKGIKIARSDKQSVAFVTFLQRSDIKKALQRNAQFMGGSKIEVVRVPGDESYEEKTANSESKDNVYEDRQTETTSVTSAILETGRLFIRNLPYSCTEDDLQYLLKKFGEVSDLQIIINKHTGQCKGFAIATFMFPENAVAAFSALDGTVFKGRMMHVLAGDEKREPKPELVEDQKSAFQKEKAVKLKANAGKAHSWNALFLGANAVADTLAAKLNVDKSDLLTGEGETSAGVRLALAETRLVRETRAFLMKAGVSLDAFSRPATKRSTTVIIVKNLPAGVEIDELERMFERFGPITKALMPESGVSAIIEMQNTVDARKAFSALAYSRFRTQPLYLEWAPFDVFAGQEKTEESAVIVDKPTSSSVNEEEVKQEKEIKEEDSEVIEKEDLTKEEKKKLRRSKKHREKESKIKKEEPQENESDDKRVISTAGIGFDVKEEQTQEHEEMQTDKEEKTVLNERNEDEKESDEEDIPAEGTTVFVKNLNFETTDESLMKKFGLNFKIRSAVVSRKRDPSDTSKSLSMGFGFVKFYSQDDAKTALKEMQGILLDGHCLELKLSHREEVVDESRKRKGVSLLDQGESTKIMVRNIPFQASRKEVKQLFATFGELRAFRMPKKMGSSAEGHRGFGFVDFLSKGDARRAFDALVHSTHLYGRRLVLEWAKQEESIDELRDKAISSLSGGTKEMRKQTKRMREIEKDLTKIDDD